MFYSKDLLSRRSPLGAIWTIAHGKKLSKSKLLGISVQEICNQILQPEVPHSLRLQGILVGGVVVVYNKQQVYLLEDVQDMVRQVKEAIHIDTFGGKATLKRGNDKAKHATITLDDTEGLMDDARFADINNLAAKLDDARFVPLTQKLGSFSEVILEEDPDLFAMPALSNRDTGRLSSHASEQEEVIGRLQSVSGKWRKGKGGEPKDKGSAAMKQHGGLGGADIYAEQDEMFGVDLEGMMIMDHDLMGADLASLPHDLNNAAALEHQRKDDDDGSLSPKSAERRSSLVAEMRAEFELGDREELPEWEEGQEDDLEREVPTRKRGRGAASAKEGNNQHQPAKKQGFASLPLHKVCTDALEDVQIKTKEFRDWTQDSSPLLFPRGFKRKGALLPTGNTADIISGPAVRKSAACATEGFGTALKATFALAPLVAWAPDTDLTANGSGDLAAACEAPLLVLCKEMQELDLSLQTSDSAQRGAAAEAAAARLEGGVEKEGNVGDAYPMDEIMMMHEDAELQDQLHELPFDNVEVERLRAGGALTPGAAAVLADPSGLDSAQRQQLMQQGLLHQPGSAHTSASGNSSLHLGTRPGARRGSSMAGSDNDLMLPGSRDATPCDIHGLNGSAHSRQQCQPLMQWGESTLADLLPSIGSGLAQLGLRAESEEPEQGLMTVPRSSSKFESDPLATTQFQLLESSGHATQVQLQDCVSKNTATVTQIFRQRLALQEAAGSTDPAVSFLELAQQLTRSEAVKMFMQVLVTHSMCFVSASQEVAYGDILIRASHHT